MDPGRRAFLTGRRVTSTGSVKDGQSITISKDCLAYAGVVCQRCGDICQDNAIRFNYSARAMPVPNLNLEACTACGECVPVCPSDAITLNNKTVKKYD